jgi:hypothetical protein
MSKLAKRILFALTLIGFAWPALARAETREDRRPKPDYDGRGEPPTTVGDVLIWVPRVIAAPFYLVSEYLLRAPFHFLVTAAEGGLLTDIANFFTFDKEHKVGLVPTAFIDFGFKPSVGLYFFWDDFIAKKNDFRMQFGTWGPDWINVSGVDRIHLDKNVDLSLKASYSKRKDWRFYGLGPDALDENMGRYNAELFEAGPQFDFKIGDPLRLRTAAGVRDHRFIDSGCCDDLSVADRVRQGAYALPPGFGGYTLVWQRMEASLDSRPKKPEPQHGVRVAAEVEPAFDVTREPRNSHVRYGGTVAGYVDITGKNRVLSLQVSTLFSDPILGSGSDIPFRELVNLGGSGLMRGYLYGRLADRSAFVANLQYEWPIWVWLDGTMQVSTGNVFGAGLKDLDVKKFRLSSGIGFRTNTSSDSQLEVLVGFGTDTFEQGAKVSSFRLAIGATRGF